jgi:hypothetical protein
MIVKSSIETKKYRLTCHPHQNKWSFLKKPTSGGKPSMDKKYRDKKRSKKRIFHL